MRLAIGSPTAGNYELTFTGISDRRYVIESSADLLSWTQLTEIVTDSSPKGLIESVEMPKLFFRAR